MNFSFFTPSIDHPRIVAAIAAAERHTSGEIRVVVSRGNISDPVAEAQRQFERLGMTRTQLRNGVLILFAPSSHTFAVIGDTAIHEKCGDLFWRELAAAMTGHFKRGDFTTGLVYGIERAGALLAETFPGRSDDRDELTNAIEET